MLRSARHGLAPDPVARIPTSIRSWECPGTFGREAKVPAIPLDARPLDAAPQRLPTCAPATSVAAWSSSRTRKTSSRFPWHHFPRWRSPPPVPAAIGLMHGLSACGLQRPV
jgi:hypothetical protein